MTQLDRIEQKLDQLLTMMGSMPQPVKGLSLAEQAISLVRQGKVEESKALLKAHSKRRSE